MSGYVNTWRARRMPGSARAIAAILSCALSIGCTPRTGLPNHALSTLPAAPVEVRLTPYFRDLRTILAVRGDDTLRLLLDTGGGHTLVTPEVARRLGCEPSGRSVGHRMTGERVEFQWCAGLSLRVQDVPLAAGPIAVFDLGAVLPRELPAVDGLIALTSFTELVVTIDLAADRLVIESEHSAAARRAEQRPLRSRVATGDDGSSLTVLLAARGASTPAWLLLDSGNLVGTILSPQGAKHLANATMAPTGQAIDLDLEVMGLERRNTQALVRDIIYDGVLGASFFRQHVLTLDLRGKQPGAGANPRSDR